VAFILSCLGEPLKRNVRRLLFLYWNMSFGCPAHFGESRTYHLQDEELASLVRAALDDLGWRCQVASRTEFLARTPFMFLGSWGERLKVEILLDGVVAIESRSIWPGFDSGRNKRNVQTFFVRFEHAERMYRLVETPKEPPLAFDADGLSPLGRLLVDSRKD
jgi:hypothetical protein